MLKVGVGEVKVFKLREVGSKYDLDQKLHQEREEAKATSKAALKREIRLHKRLISFTE